MFHNLILSILFLNSELSKNNNFGSDFYFLFKSFVVYRDMKVNS